MELETASTPNQMYDQLLTELGDPIGKASSEAQRFSRACRLFHERGVELILLDEIQHIMQHNTARFAWKVTEAFKRLLNAGVAPIVLAGDETATVLFKSNPQLRNRMLIPAQMPRLCHKNPDDVDYLCAFLTRLDQEMVEQRIVDEESNLGAGLLPPALCLASQGAVGTACNIVREALKFALERGRGRITAEDLARAIDEWAIPMGFATSNPLIH